MPWLLTLIWAFASQTLGIAMPLNVSTLTVGAPTEVAELDLGKLKGELRQIGWSADGTQIYIQTVDGNPPNEKLRHFIVATTGGALAPVDAQPEWAKQYWLHKSDRNAPGAPAIEIDVKQGLETIKAGTGPAGVLDRTSSPAGANNINNLDAIANGTDQYQKQNVWRFTLFDETISVFMNQRPIPGLMFGWGPRGTGAIVYTDPEGHLAFLDQEKHKRTVAGVKDATLPAWSMDGARLAYAVKDGRKKYKLVWCTIAK